MSAMKNTKGLTNTNLLLSSPTSNQGNMKKYQHLEMLFKKTRNNMLVALCLQVSLQHSHRKG